MSGHSFLQVLISNHFFQNIGFNKKFEMTLNENKTKLSVCIITYNHSFYIKECLDSIIPQVVNLNAEIIIGDDFSSDGTREILIDYKAKFPKLIKLIFQSKNTGGTQNYIDVHKNAKGTYVSQVDGDDFVFPGKFEAQIKILDSMSEVSFCCHGLKVLNSNLTMGTSKSLPIIGSIEDLIKLYCYFGSSSVMYRRSKSWKLPVQGKDNVVDYTFHLQRSRNGKIFLDKNVYGAYRKHPSSISKLESYSVIVQECYEDAFDYAVSIGVDRALVQKSRLIKRISFAAKNYLAGHKFSYQKYIRLDKRERPYASTLHKLLSSFYFLSCLIYLFVLKIYAKTLLSKLQDFFKLRRNIV